MAPNLCKRMAPALFILILLMTLPIVSFANSLIKKKHVPGELVIKLKQETMVTLRQAQSPLSLSSKKTTGVASLDALAKQFNAVNSKPVFKAKVQLTANPLSRSTSSLVQDFDTAQYQKIVFPQDVDLDAIIKAYENDPNIAFAEPNYIRRPIGTSEDQADDTETGVEQDGKTSGTILGLPGKDTDEDYNKQWHLDVVNAPQA